MRAITFPKTGDGEWTNRETGVRIRRQFRNGCVPYVIETPGASVNSRGENYLNKRSEKTLASARQVAADIAERARGQIAEAYAEAAEENHERDSRDGGAQLAQLDAFFARHQYKGSRTPGAVRKLVEVDHERAIQTQHSIEISASAYVQGMDSTVTTVNDDQGWYGNAVRAEMQRREEQRERMFGDLLLASHAETYDRDRVTAAQVIAQARQTNPTTRTPTEAYIAGETDEMPETGLTTAERRGWVYLSDSREDNLPDNPGIRMGQTGSGKTSADDTFLVNVRRYQHAGVTEIPDEALAMNAGFDMAAAVASGHPREEQDMGSLGDPNRAQGQKAGDVQRGTEPDRGIPKGVDGHALGGGAGRKKSK
jgi:hypothetical protein